uniref:Regulatory protein zeste n=1 Tax=Parascaris univalens TaxID=6257 RepID=A0A915ANE5_PARUN
MSSVKSHRVINSAYALRLVQEVAQEKWLLKPATRQDRARRKSAWSRIAAKLNGEFNADFTPAELERKIDHVKAKAHKKQAQRSRLDRKKLPGPRVFDLSSDDDHVPDVIEASVEGDSQSSSNNVHERRGRVVENPADIQGTADDCIMIEEDGNNINDGSKQVKLATVESTEHGTVMAAEQLAVKATGQSIDASDKHLQTQPSAPLNVVPSLHTYTGNVNPQAEVNDITERGGSEAVGSTQDEHLSDWVSDFKAKLLERLSTVPTDRIIEVHRLIRHEIDSLYAEEVAKEIEARFKDPSRETVKGRVLHLVDG